jgi:ATP-dependent Clp protease ATP-binding subunit ClpA
MLTRAARELDTTRIEPDYGARKRLRREGNGVDMQSLADEISRETEASVASRSADYDDTDPLHEIRRRLRKLTYGDMIAMAEQMTGVEGYKPAVNTEEMAAMLHRWSTTEQSDERQSPAVRSR